MDKQSQCTKIIRMLRKAPVNGVPNYKFAQVGILGYTARMSDLRKDGLDLPEVDMPEGFSGECND